MPYRNKVVRVHRLILVKGVVALVVPSPRECKRCVRKIADVKATLACSDFPICKYIINKYGLAHNNYSEYKYIDNVEFILIRKIRKEGSWQKKIKCLYLS